MTTGRGMSGMLRQVVATVYHQARTFIVRDMWLFEVEHMTTVRRCMVRQLQILVIVVRGFFLDHQCLLRASALTYTTLLALVPMLAFTFAFLKGLGVQNQLEPLLIDKLAVGSEQTVKLIINYINNVKVGTLGAIGLGSLLFSTLLQFGTIEKAVNEIWGVHKGRPLLRKVTDYISVMVIAPVLLFLAIAVTATLQSQALIASLLKTQIIGDAVVLGFTLLPYVAVWVVFSFFYMFIPNTRVQLLPACVGGLIAGTLWQLAQQSYIAFQVGLGKYNAIYGTFAQLPVLMVWLYISWIIVLLGAEIVFACQHAETYAMERLSSLSSFHVRETVAIALYFSLVRTFEQGTGSWSAVTFAQQQRIPLRLLRDILHTLAHAKLLIEDATLPQHYVPGRHPDTITPWHVLSALRDHGSDLDGLFELRDPSARALMRQVEADTRRTAAAASIPQWLVEHDPVRTTPPVEQQSS